MFLNTFDYSTSVCGLLSFTPRVTNDQEPPDHEEHEDILPVTLDSVNVSATLIHAAAEVTISQAYINRRNEEVETFFYFPIHSEDVFVTNFEVDIGGSFLKSIVLRDSGRKESIDAIKQHPKRFWIPPDGPQDFYLSRVGYLKPGCRANVTISYVTEAKQNAERQIQLIIPNTVVPRFKLETSSDAEDGESLPANFSENKVPLKFQVDVLFEGEGSINSVGSPSHPVRRTSIGHPRDKPNWTSGVIEFKGEGCDLDRDFVAAVILTDVFSPRMYLEETEEEMVLMSVFCPVLSQDEEFVTSPEFLIAVDLIEDADARNEILDLLLRSLPQTSTFNVIGHGASPEDFLFPDFLEHTDGSLQKVFTASAANSSRHLDTAAILEKVFTEAYEPSCSRQIILILQKSFQNLELEKLVALVKHHNETHVSRLFVVSIGNRPDQASIQKLASAGGGAAFQIPTFAPADHKQFLITSLIQRCTSQSLAKVELRWDEWVDRVQHPAVHLPVPNGEESDLEILEEIGGKSDKQPFIQIPDGLNSPVFSGTQFVCFGIFVRKYIPKVLEIEGTSYRTPSESLAYGYKLKLHENRERHIVSTQTITKLAYAKALKQLEEKMETFTYDSRKTRSKAEETKERIMQIACREGIPSMYTGFATVNVESGEEIEGNWTRQTRYDTSSSTRGLWTCAWHRRPPSGSVARSKLNFVRKLTVADVVKPKLPRRIPSGDADNVIDLTEESERESENFLQNPSESEVITIVD